MKKNVMDIFMIPFVYPSAWLLKKIRCAGIGHFPLCKKALMDIGVFPISNNYYEPQFDYRSECQQFSQDRNLTGIEWNIAEQIEILSTFSYAAELAKIPQSKTNSLDFYFNNDNFESGDAEYWYQIIRARKPLRIIEVGSGYSTLMAMKAIRNNQREDPTYSCQHICIEPYERPWLEKTGVKVMRKKVEDIELSFFTELAANDILFIDSSHIIRPQGDVLFEYLKLLPILKSGVIVHIHDIFSPKNYLKCWLVNEVQFWNEQYLLEAFLTHNNKWKIIGALNYLHHNHYEKLQPVAPYLSRDREPGSFYIQRI